MTRNEKAAAEVRRQLRQVGSPAERRAFLAEASSEVEAARFMDVTPDELK